MIKEYICENLDVVMIYCKMQFFKKIIQIIAKFNELIIYWIWIDCTVSIAIEKLDSCDILKTYGQVFHSNKHKCVEKTFCWKLLSFEIWQDLCWSPLY